MCNITHVKTCTLIHLKNINGSFRLWMLFKKHRWIFKVWPQLSRLLNASINWELYHKGLVISQYRTHTICADTKFTYFQLSFWRSWYTVDIGSGDFSAKWLLFIAVYWLISGCMTSSVALIVGSRVGAWWEQTLLSRTSIISSRR